MTVLNQVYRCNVCGNVVEVLHTGKGTLVCCGKPMELLMENTVDASREKHVPVMDKSGETLTVRVGSAPHPMEETHYIEWIELLDGGRAQRQYLKPGEPPEASFAATGGQVAARAYCNLHGLWRSE